MAPMRLRLNLLECIALSRNIPENDQVEHEIGQVGADALPRPGTFPGMPCRITVPASFQGKSRNGCYGSLDGSEAST